MVRSMYLLPSGSQGLTYIQDTGACDSVVRFETCHAKGVRDSTPSLVALQKNLSTAHLKPSRTIAYPRSCALQNSTSRDHKSLEIPRDPTMTSIWDVITYTGTTPVDAGGPALVSVNISTFHHRTSATCPAVVGHCALLSYLNLDHDLVVRLSSATAAQIKYLSHGPP